MAVGRPGGQGVTVAVLDTGIAYADRDRFQRSPDFSRFRFVKGYDFVDDDPYPNDDNGHGTHVAGTIAEGTGNAVGLTGLAYGVKLMPVKVLDRNGEGDSQRIAQGIRWAADHGAKIINLSFEFPSEITRSQIPNILDAIRHARPRACSWSAPRATRRPPRSPTRRARATSSPSARRPSTAARPTTPTRARTWTSSPPAAASTPRSRATRTAARASRRASTSSR